MTPYRSRNNEILGPFDWGPGEEDQLELTWTNIDMGSRAALIALTDAAFVTISAAIEGANIYTYYTRKFAEQENSTGNFTLMLLCETWLNRYAQPAGPAVPVSTHKVEAIGQDVAANLGGSGRAEVYRAPGISEPNSATDITALVPQKTNRVIHTVSLSEAAKGAREITVQEKISFPGDDATDALVTMIEIAWARNKPACTRTWWRRTAAAKDSLIGFINPSASGTDTDLGDSASPSSVAVTGFTFNGVAYIHTKVDIEDNHDTTFNVIQTAHDVSEATDGGWGATTGGYVVRQSNGDYKSYLWFRAYFATEAGAMALIGTLHSGQRGTFNAGPGGSTSTAGIPLSISDNQLNDAGSWNIIHTAISPKTSTLQEAYRVEEYNGTQT
jgi:hypothetical protein